MTADHGDGDEDKDKDEDKDDQRIFGFFKSYFLDFFWNFLGILLRFFNYFKSYSGYY